MFYYILLPISTILLIVLQSTVTDMVFSGRFLFEMSLVVVIYAGFRFDLIKGTILAFVLGFVFDCVDGSVPGLFAFIYITVFLFTFFISDWLDAGKTHVVVFFSFLCALLKEIILNLFYYLAFNIHMSMNVLLIVSIQVLVIGLLAPPLFYLMDRAEIFNYEKRV